MMYSNMSNGSASRYQNRRPCTTPSTIPIQSSVPNSLRSTQMSLRSANNSTLLRNSILIDTINPMMTNEANNEIPKDNGESVDHQIVETKVSSNILPLFILELISLTCIATMAYFLRFHDHFEVLTRGFFCDDQTISYPYRPSFGRKEIPIMTGYSDETFYGITVGTPLLLIFVGEILRSIFITNTRTQIITAQSGCITIRIHLFLRRIFRIYGGYFYGLLLTSIITDTLKVTTGRLRPYFLNVCESISQICRNGLNSNITEELKNYYYYNFPHKWIDPNEFPDDILCLNETSDIREARMSFPSSTASIASFSAFFMVFYISFVITFKSGHIIKLWLNSATIIPLLIVISGKVTTHKNHIEDIIFSLIISAIFAIYICFMHLNLFRDKENNSVENQSELGLTEEEESAWFWKYFHIPRVNLLRRSARYFRKKQSPETVVVRDIRDNCCNGSAYVNPAFDHKDIIDSNRTNVGYHDNYRH